MAQDATVTAADIARLAGVGRAAVSNWRKRHDDFPEPVGGTSTSPSFSLSEVQDWLRAQGKLKESASDEHLWHELRKITEDVELADVLTFTGAFLLYLHRNRQDWTELSALPDEQVCEKLPPAVQTVAKGVTGGPVFPSVFPVRYIPLVRRVAVLAEERGAPGAFEFLRERYLDLHKRRTYETPRAVVRLVLDLAAAGHPGETSGDGIGEGTGEGTRVVLDPACGSGGLLVGALEHHRPDDPDGPGRLVRLYGQDSDETVAKLTAVRLALRTDSAEIHAGDSLRHDAFVGTEADLVICNPPFSERNWGYDELTTDPRWEYGLPPRSESELAWVQHALSHCRPGGMAVLVMPPAAAVRRAGRRIRAQLLRRGALRAVITLPLGAVPNMAVPPALWVLRRPVPGERLPSQLLMVDVSEPRPVPLTAGPPGPPGSASAVGGVGGAGAVGVVGQGVAPLSAIATGPGIAGVLGLPTTGRGAAPNTDFATPALESWRGFGTDPEAEFDAPGQSRAVRIIDLLDDEVDLTPSRYISRLPSAPAIEQVGEHRARVLELIDEMARLVPTAEPAETDGTDTPLVAVAELVRMGLVTVHPGPVVKPARNGGDGGRGGARETADGGADRGAPGGGTGAPVRTPGPDGAIDDVAQSPVLTGRDVSMGCPPSGRFDELGIEAGKAVVLRAGDVVLPTIARAPAAKVITPGGPEDGAVLGRHLVLLRPDPARLDPYYLAGALRGSLNLRHFQTMSTGYRVDVRRAEVPLPPVEEQRDRGAVFRRLDEFETALRRTAEFGVELARLVGDGLVDGKLRPPAR